VNLVLQERLVPELLQDAFNAEAVVREALPLLDDPQARQRVAEGYQRLRQALGEPGVTRRAAAAILDALPQAASA
jgi:lipid-A-disaccharide synthase